MSETRDTFVDSSESSDKVASPGVQTSKNPALAAVAALVLAGSMAVAACKGSASGKVNTADGAEGNLEHSGQGPSEGSEDEEKSAEADAGASSDAGTAEDVETAFDAVVLWTNKEGMEPISSDTSEITYPLGEVNYLNLYSAQEGEFSALEGPLNVITLDGRAHLQLYPAVLEKAKPGEKLEVAFQFKGKGEGKALQFQFTINFTE